jgi:DNA-binding NarL/FixJ family response regulator
MEMQQLNLYILSERALVVCGLKHYLQERFGARLRIVNFYNRKTCLRKINKSTQVVIVDEQFQGAYGADVRRSIKTINPDVEVIMHSSGEEVASELSSLCQQKLNPGTAFPERFKNNYN